MEEISGFHDPPLSSFPFPLYFSLLFGPHETGNSALPHAPCHAVMLTAWNPFLSIHCPLTLDNSECTCSSLLPLSLLEGAVSELSR